MSELLRSAMERADKIATLKREAEKCMRISFRLHEELYTRIFRLTGKT